MTEPYQKVGRGGAGNFYSKEDVQPSDLESQSQPTSDLVQSISAQQPPPEYAHTGRGGAGNWVKPADLPASNTDPDSTSTLPTTNPNPTIPARNSSIGGAGPVYRGGRGGAGNYDWGAAEEEERKRKGELERVEEEGRRRFEGEVESALKGLTPPGRVVVGDTARKRGF